MGFISIYDYVNGLSANGKNAVNNFADFMAKEFPEIPSKISFSMPMWWLGAKMYDGYVAISAAKNHYSIHFHEESDLEELKQLFPTHAFGKKCININYNDENSIRVVEQQVEKYIKRTK